MTGRPVKSPRPLSIVGSIRITLSFTAKASPTRIALINHPIQGMDPAKVAPTIFPRNMDPPAFEFKRAAQTFHLTDTLQLALCLALLQVHQEPTDLLDTAVRQLDSSFQKRTRRIRQTRGIDDGCYPSLQERRIQ
jgi:hypothetical protein